MLTVHPKEKFGRIYSWIKKGKLLYWNKQKGRKFLQDSALIKLEQYGTELSPLLSASENISESQGENLNFYAAPRTGKFQKNSLKLLLGGGVIDIRTFERRSIMEELDAA